MYFFSLTTHYKVSSFIVKIKVKIETCPSIANHLFSCFNATNLTIKFKIANNKQKLSKLLSNSYFSFISILKNQQINCFIAYN